MSRTFLREFGAARHDIQNLHDVEPLCSTQQQVQQNRFVKSLCWYLFFHLPDAYTTKPKLLMKYRLRCFLSFPSNFGPRLPGACRLEALFRSDAETVIVYMISVNVIKSHQYLDVVAFGDFWMIFEVQFVMACHVIVFGVLEHNRSNLFVRCSVSYSVLVIDHLSKRHSNRVLILSNVLEQVAAGSYYKRRDEYGFFYVSCSNTTILLLQGHGHR